MWHFRTKSLTFLGARNSGCICCQEDKTMAGINMPFCDFSGIVSSTEKKLLFFVQHCCWWCEFATYTRQNRRVVHLKVVLNKIHLAMTPLCKTLMLTEKQFYSKSLLSFIDKIFDTWNKCIVQWDSYHWTEEMSVFVIDLCFNMRFEIPEQCDEYMLASYYLCTF